MEHTHPRKKWFREEAPRATHDSQSGEGDLLHFSNDLRSNGKLETKIAGLEELEKTPKSDQEKINLLVQHINDLLAVIRKLEDQLQHTSDAGIVGRTMVAGLAHDLRNPMSVISSCAQFCLENEQLTPVTKDYLQMIQENSRAVNKMLNHFLEFSRANLTFKSVNLSQIIKKTWPLAIMDTGGREITFKERLAEDLPEVYGDPEKIERVFLNLFLNAAQAVSQNGAKGTVTVQTRFLRTQNMAEVNIIDNGPGIPTEIQEKIFDPFFTTKKEGTGLGLHLCQYFIDQHKGKIIIGKPREGGTKVTVKLPVTRERGMMPY
jgi:signal transduction histidine kinase